MKTTTKITTFTTDPTISTGPIAQLDLSRHGKISVTFHVGEKFIGVEIAGISSFSVFYKKPKNKKEESTNKMFVERYVNKCHNKEEIIQHFNQ